MKKVIFLTFFLFVFVCGCEAPSIKPYEEVKDGILFKLEYEKYNNTNYYLEIPNENSFKYLDENNIEQVLSSKSVIYFGYADCDSCRIVTSMLLDYTKHYNIQVYYVDLSLERTTYKIINENLEKDFTGTVLYSKLLKYFNFYLDEYIIESDDKTYSINEKYISAPTLAFVNDGEVELFFENFSCSEKEECSSIVDYIKIKDQISDYIEDKYTL